MRPRFHLAIPVTDLESTRAFYTELLACGVGRESDRWIDFDLAGHQVTAHLVDAAEAGTATNPVDGHAVPVRHFGVILDPPAWDELAERLRGAGVDFLIEPHVRFAGTAGEQRTLFLLDPSGNGLEFKAFADDAMVFARDA
jgi:extradiol dioxygenase family protein